MIPVPLGVKVWLATGHTDVRKGFASLALLAQEELKRDPLGGHVFCFRGRRGDLLKIIWHNGQAANLYVRRLERGRFLWPSAADGVIRDHACANGLPARSPMLIPHAGRLMWPQVGSIDGPVSQVADGLQDGLRVAEEIRARRLTVDQEAAGSDLAVEPFRGDVQPACSQLLPSDSRTDRNTPFSQPFSA